MDLALAGEDVEKLVACLSPVELTYWDELLEELRKDKDSEMNRKLWHVDYVRQPPTMNQFLDDDYYIGSIARPTPDNESSGVWPAWKKILTRDFNLDSTLHNVVISGSMGSGKCLGYGELCLMHDGTTKAVQGIKPGDQLMGDDSTPRNVLSIARGRGQLYRISPVKGEPFVCNNYHILCLKSFVNEEITEVSVDDFIKWPAETQHQARLYRVRQHVKNDNCLKTGFTVIPIGEGDYYGFEIDGNHRFLLNDFTVTHNTFNSVIILLYRLAIATCLRNPQGFFGLAKGVRVVYNVLSITKMAVSQTAWADCRNFMAHSPYFTEMCGFNPEIEYTNSQIPLSKGLFLTSGSRGQHVIGTNLQAILLDEGNWRLEANPDEKAYELYNEVRTRISNRFRKSVGYLPAITLLASSAKDESSFTEKIIQEIEEAKEPSAQRVYRHSIYTIKRHTLTLGKRWFKVVYGLKNMEPYLLTGWYTEEGEKIAGLSHDEAPAGAQTELVPEMFYEEYRRRPKVALQSNSGISTGGAFRLFPSMVDFQRCTELAEKDGVANPVLGKSEFLSISTEDDRNIWDFLDHKVFLRRIASRIEPIRHPYALRYAHLDLATQTMAGLSVGHLVGNQLVEGLIKDGKPFSEYRLIFEYDFLLTVIAGTVKPISLEKIQNFIFWLRDRCNYVFGAVTADAWQSDMPLQMLESRGFKTGKLSLDREKIPYYAFRAAVEELRLRPYSNTHLFNELAELHDGDKKIDHTKLGSKDLSDSAAGCYYSAMTSDNLTSISAQSTNAITPNSTLETNLQEPAPITINVPTHVRRVPEFDV